MANKGRSSPGLFGTTNHYDEEGNSTGYSSPGLFGTTNHYDEEGNSTGYSSPGFSGTINHYDSKGRQTGYSSESLFGGYDHYDAHGNKIGHSNSGFAGSYNHSDDTSQGCYVATCVYGSYDCPQVWTLRRFRDDTLARTALGRTFIRAYYALSPTAVRLFGTTKWFRAIWRGPLDRMVSKLNVRGVADTPYQDKAW